MTGARYTKDHEYVRVDGDIGVIGVTDYAQSQLGDIVFVDLPPVGKNIAKGQELAVIESVKAASEVYAPVSGEVVEVNGAIETAAAIVNEDLDEQRLAGEAAAVGPRRNRRADGRSGL